MSALADKPADKLRLFGSRAEKISCKGQELRVEPLGDGSQLGSGNWILLHAAIVGADRFESETLAAIRTRNDQLLDRVLALADSAQTQRLVYFSSGAAGRPPSGSPGRRAYSVMKLDHERALLKWSELSGNNILCPRIFNLAGPFINHPKYYALGDFILSQSFNGVINIASNGLVFRNYVHVLDMAQVIMSFAIDPRGIPQVFDVCTSDSVELTLLAQTVAEAFGADLNTINYNKERIGPPDSYLGVGDLYQQRLRKLGMSPTSLFQMVKDTIVYLKNNGELASVEIPKLFVEPPVSL